MRGIDDLECWLWFDDCDYSWLLSPLSLPLTRPASTWTNLSLVYTRNQAREGSRSNINSEGSYDWLTHVSVTTSPSVSLPLYYSYSYNYSKPRESWHSGGGKEEAQDEHIICLWSKGYAWVDMERGDAVTWAMSVCLWEKGEGKGFSFQWNEKKTKKKTKEVEGVRWRCD